MEYLFIYLLQLTDVIEFSKILLFVILAFGLMSLPFVADAMTKKEFEEYWNTFYDVLKVVFISLIILFMLPTRQTLLLCGGVAVGKMAIDKISKSTYYEKVTKIIELELDKKVKEYSIE